eukprot:3873020-Karenia_brevis.AAC.1
MAFQPVITWMLDVVVLAAISMCLGAKCPGECPCIEIYRYDLTLVATTICLGARGPGELPSL